MELLEEIARGTSIEELRARLTRKDDAGEKSKEPSPSEIKNKIPDDLVQIQAYIRWEKAGKPNYSPEQQLVHLLIFCFYTNYKLFTCGDWHSITSFIFFFSLLLATFHGSADAADMHPFAMGTFDFKLIFDSAEVSDNLSLFFSLLL